MKQFFTILALSAISLSGWSQCVADFTMSNDTINAGDSVNIFNASTSSNNATFTWTMPGGLPATNTTFDTTTSFSVTYGTAGTYLICLDQNDSGWSCTDSICYTVTVLSGMSASVTGSNATCGSCNGSATAAGSNGVPPYSYLWSNGSATQTTTGLCAGTYTVTITDANSATAQATATINAIGGVNVNLGPDITACNGDSVILDATINFGGPYTYAWSNGSTASTIGVSSQGTYYATVTDSNGCSGVDSVNVTFNSGPQLTTSATHETCVSCCDGTVSASAGAGPYFYSWSNAAGNVASQTGLCPGTYSVTVEDTLTGCTTITSLVVNAFTNACYTLAGEITQGENVRVYLIQEANATLTAVDSTLTDSNGLYVFTGVCNGTYYVKGALLPGHAAYATTIPTYYDADALWGSATSLVVNNAAIFGVDFTLLAGVNTGGAGFVGGLLSQGANRGEGDPVVGAYVAAYDETGDFAAFAKSDINGEYAMDNLALGTYTIYVDVLGKTPYPHIATLTAENPSNDNRDFEIVGDAVKPIVPLGLNEIANNDFSIFPNPANNEIIIASEMKIQTVEIFTMMGDKISIKNQLGEGINTLDVSGLAAGTYLMQIRGELGVQHKTFIKQ